MGYTREKPLVHLDYYNSVIFVIIYSVVTLAICKI